MDDFGPLTIGDDSRSGLGGSDVASFQTGTGSDGHEIYWMWIDDSGSDDPGTTPGSGGYLYVKSYAGELEILPTPPSRRRRRRSFLTGRTFEGLGMAARTTA